MISQNSGKLVVDIIEKLQYIMKEWHGKNGCLAMLSNACNQNNVIVKPFKVATWKPSELAKQWQEIKTFVFCQNVDILLVSETHSIHESYIFQDIHCITQYIR